jgi:colicin import membrane protein
LNTLAAPLRILPGERRALLYAVLVHVAIVLVVAVGLRFQSRPAVQPVIQARMVPDVETKKEVERRKQQERERAAQDAQKKREEEAARAAEQKRKLEVQQKLDAEKKRKDAERAAEVKRKKESAERQKAAEQSFKEQLAQEEKQRATDKARAEQAARLQSEIDRHKALIRQTVQQNWVRPAGWTSRMECVVRVRLAPTGEVISATIVRSSGNVLFDRSVENAVYKSSPLPMPQDKDLIESVRDLELRFRPEGGA